MTVTMTVSRPIKTTRTAVRCLDRVEYSRRGRRVLICPGVSWCGQGVLAGYSRGVSPHVHGNSFMSTVYLLYVMVGNFR